MRLIRLWLVVMMAGAIVIACSRGDDDDRPTVTALPATPSAMTSEANATPTFEPTATATISPTNPSQTATSSPEVNATAPVRPIATVASTATATPTSDVEQPVTLELLSWGFSEVQEYDEVGFGFIVENPDSVNAVLNSEYLVRVYDGATELVTDAGYLDYVLPGERIGVGGSIFIPAGSDADSIVVELTAGSAAPADLDPGFSVSHVAYYSDNTFPSATGVISTRSEYPLQDFEVFAVGYDESGEIIGGGYTFVSFIQAGSSTGVELILASAEEPATVELFPVVTSLTVYAISAPSVADALPLTIINNGYGMSSYEGELGWGFIAENPNSGLAAETTAYQITAYAADGTVLSVYASYISLLLPGEQLGLGGSFYIPPGTIVDRLQFEILGRYFSETTIQPDFLTSSDVSYVAGEFSPRVTGTISNGAARDLSDVEVYAIAYDASGQIIGGGFTFASLIEAESQADVEVTIAVGEDPAIVDLFATVSSLSDIE